MQCFLQFFWLCAGSIRFCLFIRDFYVITVFSIICYEDVDYQDLKGCSILGFYGNKTYILESWYDEFLEDTTSREYKACAEASKVLKKSFVSIVKEPTE